MTAPASGRGGKADGLAWLAEAGESVPTFFTVGPGEDESVLLARFDELFDGLWIHGHPTQERGQYLVLQLDFSPVNTDGDAAAIRKAVK